MKKSLSPGVLIVGLMLCFAVSGYAQTSPKKENTWVFLMAGQSNMAGRGLVEAQDTVTNPRILTINRENKLIKAREPLHFYQPSLAGLDCGLSFARELLKQVGDSITIVMIPTAFGGTSVEQWLGDSLFRALNLPGNFGEKMMLAKNTGTVKGILWHQGESNAQDKLIPNYKNNLTKLFSLFRKKAENNALPIFTGELGSYSKTQDKWDLINNEITKYAASDNNTYVIPTNDFKHKGDFVHFDSEGQRVMGQRFAEKYIQICKLKK